MLTSLFASLLLTGEEISKEHSLTHVPYMIIGTQDYEIPNLGPAQTHLDVQKIANHLGLKWTDINGTIVFFEPPLSQLPRSEIVSECFLFPLNSLARMGLDEVTTAFASPQPLRNYPVHCRPARRSLSEFATLENIAIESIQYFPGFNLVPVQPDPSEMSDTRRTLLRPVRFVWTGYPYSADLAIPANEVAPPSLTLTPKDLFGDDAADLSSRALQTAESGPRRKLTWEELNEQTNGARNQPNGWKVTSISPSEVTEQERFFFLPEHLPQDKYPLLLSFASSTYTGTRSFRHDSRGFNPVDMAVLTRPFHPDVADYINSLFPSELPLIVPSVLDRDALREMVDPAWLSRIPAVYTEFVIQPQIVSISYRPYYADSVIVENFPLIHLRHIQKQAYLSGY